MNRRGSITAGELIAVLWADRKRILVVAMLSVVVAAYLGLTRRPLYESDSLYGPPTEDMSQLSGGGAAGLLGQFSAVSGLLGLPGGKGTSVDETLAVLESRAFTLRFIRDNGLAPALFPELWSEKDQAWKAGSAGLLGSIVGGAQRLLRNLMPAEPGLPGPRAANAGPPDDDLYKRFRENVQLTVDRRTGFVKLALRAPTPALARDWSTKMIDTVNQDLRARAMQESKAAVEVLAGSYLKDTQYDSVRTAAVTLLEGQLKRQVVTEARRDYALRVLDPPSLAEVRYSPKRTRMVIIGFVLGSIVGSAWVLLRRLRRRG